jgi:hypothetical protein
MAAVTIAAGIYLGLQGHLRHRVDRQLQATAQAIPEIAAIDYADLEVHWRPLGIELHEIRLVPQNGAAPIPIRRVHLKRFKAGPILPEHLDVSLYETRLPHQHPVVAPVAHLLSRLDMQVLDIDMHIQLVRDAAREKSWRGHLELQVRQAGILRIALAVENLDVNGVLRALDNPFNWMMVLPPVAIRAAALEFEEGGLVARMVTDRARRTGTTPMAARRQLAAEIEQAARQRKIPNLGAPLAAFVAAPVRIGYHTGNPDPVYLGRLIWSPKARDWVSPLKVSGYLADEPRKAPWQATAITIPGRPPHL